MMFYFNFVVIFDDFVMFFVKVYYINKPILDEIKKLKK